MKTSQRSTPSAASTPETDEKPPDFLATKLAAGKPIFLGGLLILLVWLAFWPALHNGFVNYDDPDYVTENPYVKQGLSPASVRWAFSTYDSFNWHPLTWLSHILDYQLFGMNAWGHHLTSVVIHSCNAILLFLVLYSMTGAMWRAFFVSALFSVHPLRTESVAWVAERKDVLSTFFWLLTLLAYERYSNAAKPGRKLFYFLALVSFALGLMAKPMLVTLPFVLLLLDYWPLRRTAQPQKQNSEQETSSGWKGLILEKLPFFVLSAASCFITVVAQKEGGAVKSITVLPFWLRLSNVLISYCRYLAKLFYPANLSVFYPYPTHWPPALVLSSGIILIGFSVFFFMVRHRQPSLIVGWFWFLGTLVPVIGLVQVGEQSMADRYTLIPSIGVLISLIWAVGELTQRKRVAAIACSSACILSVIACVAITRRQIGYWKDSETLFRHAIQVAANDYYGAHIDLGNSLFSQGRMDETIKEFATAIKLRPDLAITHKRLGTALKQTGRLEEALNEYRQVLKQNPDDASAHNEIAGILCAEGLFDRGIAEYREAMKIAPLAYQPRWNCANILLRMGRLDDALALYQETLKLNTNLVPARISLGQVLLMKGRNDDALAEFRAAVQAMPNEADGHVYLGLALGRTGQDHEATEEFELATKLNPSDAKAWNYLGSAFAQQGRFDDAIKAFEKSVDVNPRIPETHKNLGVALAARGRNEEAATQFKQALALRPNYPEVEQRLRAITSKP